MNPTSPRTNVCPACGCAYSPDCPVCQRPNPAPVPKVNGVFHRHLLVWGDAYASFLMCSRCRVGFAPNAALLDLLTECPG
jgi:hypothetical protein